MKNKQKILADVARLVMSWHRGRIDYIKGHEIDIKRPDFVWHYLLQSFATMGKSSGWYGLIGTKENYDEVRYERLLHMPSRQRLGHVKKICRKAKVRMPDKKADYICECFKWIEQKGGYLAVKKELLAQTGRDAKVKYLRQLKGVGEKNARNMMMSVYHPDFRDSIAVDVRIKSILEILNVGLTKYQDQEDFLLGAAKLARLNGWELDRLMYGYLDEFLAELHRRIYGDVSICEA